MAMKHPGMEEKPHFDMRSFRLHGKIVMTIDEKLQRGCIKLTLMDQEIFCLTAGQIIYPVPNKWGAQGWTFVDLTRANDEMITSLLEAACENVLPPRKNKPTSG